MINEKVEQYMLISDKKKSIEARHAEELAPLNEALDAIKKYLLAEMDKIGVDSLKTPAGTPYKAITKTVKTLDMEAFKEFVFNDVPKWDLVDFRPLKKGIVEYIEDTGNVPPGITIDSFTSLNIRRG